MIILIGKNPDVISISYKSCLLSTLGEKKSLNGYIFPMLITGAWLLDGEFPNYLIPKKKLIKLVIQCVFLCIAINEFTENPRFNHVQKVYSMYIKKVKGRYSPS